MPCSTFSTTPGPSDLRPPSEAPEAAALGQAIELVDLLLPEIADNHRSKASIHDRLHPELLRQTKRIFHHKAS